MMCYIYSVTEQLRVKGPAVAAFGGPGIWIQNLPLSSPKH